MLERVHRSQDGPQRVLSEVAAQLEAVGQAPWFRAEGTADGLGLEGQELQRYQSGVRTTVQKIVVEETDAIAHRLDELLTESIREKTASLQELLIANVKDRVFKEVSKEVGRKAAELRAIMEASRSEAASAIDQIDRKLHTGMEMVEGKLSSELKMDLDRHKEDIDASIATTKRDLALHVTAEAEEAAEEAVQKNMLVEIEKLRIPEQFQSVKDRLDKLEKECLVQSDLDPALAAVQKLERGMDTLSNAVESAAEKSTLLQGQVNGLKAREGTLATQEQLANLQQELERLRQAQTDSLASAQQTLDGKIAQTVSKQELQDTLTSSIAPQIQQQQIQQQQFQQQQIEQIEQLEMKLTKVETLEKKQVKQQQFQQQQIEQIEQLEMKLTKVETLEKKQVKQQQFQQQQVKQIEQLEMKLTNASHTAAPTTGRKIPTVQDEAPVSVDALTTNVNDTLATQQPVEEILSTANSSPSTNQLFSAAPTSDEQHATPAMPPGLKKMEQMKVCTYTDLYPWPPADS
eukprot:COSAG02_NODE_2420_length_8897_cov_94.692657_3_plen_518_part_00